ncbi:heterokaryon incompatibility protein-domain-containing protein, partial [Phaeosphaeria sp. MPI-PUGE-AT-0046c]
MSTCQAITTYLEKKKEYPRLPIPGPKGSYVESEKCGCRYCTLACAVYSDNVAENTVKNQSAVARNSTLVYKQASTKGNSNGKDDVVHVEFAESGLVFEGGGGSTEVFVTDHVKLVETAGQLGHYACLSHSWGGLQPLRTTLEPDTLADFKKGIEWSQLPRTFQDAVVVARKFGIQYLWIDSLCIIQDSPEDWRVQSALMAKIYQNAVITIAGSASSNPHQGLFREAEKAHVNFPSSCLEKEEGLDNVRTRKPLMHDVYQLPLMKRGWVFQERLLSSRYIHFGHNELIWECMEHITCECGCLRTREASGYEWLEPKNRLHPDSLQHLMRLPNRLTAAWRAAVVDYSRMILSYPEDIFPAISGIAKSVIEAAGWQYVAGMWKETLITDLV